MAIPQKLLEQCLKVKDKLTWEETIQYIRTKPEFRNLVEKAYFEEELSLNIDRFRKSEEFVETVKLIKQYQPDGHSILDIGSGNGISTIALALEGFKVVAIEPDSSNTVGAGAIRKLKSHYNLTNVEVCETFAEDLHFPEEYFDIVYARQCMHHAYDLEKFISQAGRVLKKGGLFITIRDHVIFNEKDKNWFLENHPLQKYYGGENAFEPVEYKNAMQKAGLELCREIKYYDSVINYFPMSSREKQEMLNVKKQRLILKLNKKIGKLSKLRILKNILFRMKKLTMENVYDETKVPGRMYSYVCIKR